MDIAKWIAGAAVGLALASAPAAQATDKSGRQAIGDWTGTIYAEEGARHIWVHIQPSLKGGFSGTLKSSERGLRSVALTSIATVEGMLQFAAADGTQYLGEWDPGRGEWTGTLTDAGKSIPLNLKWNMDSRVLPPTVR